MVGIEEVGDWWMVAVTYIHIRLEIPSDAGVGAYLTR